MGWAKGNQSARRRIFGGKKEPTRAELRAFARGKPGSAKVAKAYAQSKGKTAFGSPFQQAKAARAKADREAQRRRAT